MGLTPAQAGIALTIAGVVGFLTPAPLGRVADRRGPREVYGLLLAAEGAAVLGFLISHTFLEVAVVTSAVAACDRGKTGVRTALIVQLAPGESRVGALAGLRSCSHAGDAIGAGLGALVIALGSGPAYAAAIAFNAVTFFAYAAALRWVPRVPPSSHAEPSAPAPGARRLEAFKDLPYVTLAAICGVLTLCWGMLSAVLPLWISLRTAAPHALAGVIILISSMAIAGLQVSFSRHVDTPRAASTAALRSGLSLALCCALFACAAGPAALPAAALLLTGGVIHVLGELWFVAASWGLSVPLMPADRPAEYQGVFATGEALAVMLAPALMAAVIVPGGVLAWLSLGLGFALAGSAATPAARWALRARQGG